MAAPSDKMYTDRRSGKGEGQTRVASQGKRKAGALVCLPLIVLLLTGCLEQIQTTRIAGGSLSNFLIHLEDGELDDARAYFANGLVTPTAELDRSLEDASNSLKQYEVRRTKALEEEAPNQEKVVTITGQVRPRTLAGTPTPGADEGWQNTDIISATMIVRGPGWRILDYKLLCCEVR